MRTDNDTWDLATGVGTTATGVAASRALAGRSPDALITDVFAEPLVRAVGLDHYIRLADGDVEGDLDAALIADGMGVRTRFFDDFLLDATASGIRQAVILAVGLDARSYRLAWPAGTTVFELDQPAVIEFKTRTLAALGAAPTAELHPIGIDLREDWPAALRAGGFDQNVPTVWIAEGLLGYLPPDAQDRLFDNITALSAPGSRIAADWATHHEKPAPTRVSGMTDPTELIYVGERNAVPDYLAACGWHPETTTARHMFAVYRRPFRRDDAVAGLVDANYTTALLT